MIQHTMWLDHQGSTTIQPHLTSEPSILIHYLQKCSMYLRVTFLSVHMFYIVHQGGVELIHCSMHGKTVLLRVGLLQFLKKNALNSCTYMYNYDQELLVI